MNTAISALLYQAHCATHAHIRPVLEQFSSSILERVAQANISIRPLTQGERYSDASPHIRQYAPHIDTWAQPPAGLFVVEERCVYVQSLSAMTIVHEFGHAIDCAFGGGRYYSEKTQDIVAAFSAARSFVTPYAASRIDEYFAEAIRAYMGVNDAECYWPRATRERLEQCDPKMFRIISVLLEDNA
jgi:hypothetical protein